MKSFFPWPVDLLGIVSIPLLFLIFLLPVTTQAAGESPFLRPSGRENPHLQFECADCHRQVPEGKDTPREQIISGLEKEPVELCRECHPATEQKHHPVEVNTGRELPRAFPPSSRGEVICSTCHDVHMKDPGKILLRGFDRGIYTVRMDMCLDCHKESFAALNPHRGEIESRRCYTCHEEMPEPGNNTGRVQFRRDLSRVCNFCHNVKEKSHPMNVDPLRKLPARLPRDRDGKVHCGTCHDPHGGEGVIHFLRVKYVEFLEAGRYANPHGLSDYRSCEGCHLEVVTDKEEMKKKLRYGGNTFQICLSCHGAMESCHPVLIKPAPDMIPPPEMPLSTDGKITCLTCHYPMPPPGSKVALRGRNPGDPINAICLKCHFNLDLFRNPHTSMSEMGSCKFCHESVTEPAGGGKVRVSFISNTRLICLRCHPRDRDAHPVGNHLVEPGRELPGEFRLDSRGKITCTTCHNPHVYRRGGEDKVEGRMFVVDAPVSELCLMCHN